MQSVYSQYSQNGFYMGQHIKQMNSLDSSEALYSKL